MVDRDQIVQYLGDYLKINEIPDHCPVGLQVEGKSQVAKIVTAVSASAELFTRAAAMAADMVIVHHGMFWDRDSRVVKGHLKKRLQLLLNHDITLLCYHLCLDRHTVIGNNVLAAQELGFTDQVPLAEIGVQGRIKPTSASELVLRVESLFRIQALAFKFGPEPIERIGFCSGGAEFLLPMAVANRLDAYITGEVKESTMHYARENGMHFICAGHYATERLGIHALGEHLAQRFAVEVQFLELPNPV